MPDPTVSIIVPTFNRARYLPECLDSLLAQTLPASEIIVVNDGSTDDTARVIRPYLDRITYVEKENGGKSTALNLVMPGIQSDYVWIFDDDDVALPDALEIHVGTLEANPGAGFTYSTYYEGQTGPNGRIREGALHALVDPYRDALLAQLLEGCFLAQPGIVVRASCYREMSPFDSRLIRSQDYDMLLRLSRRFQSIRIEKPTYIYRAHSGMRGSIASTFPAERQGIEWFKYDKIIFERLYDELTLSEYLAGNQKNQPLAHPEKRQALLRRMRVMATRGLWQHATTDLERLSQDNGLQEPLSEFERRLCRKTMGNKLAIEETLFKKSFLPIVGRLCRGLGGTEMRYEFARELYYHVVREFRKRDYRFAVTVFVSVIRILGFPGAVEWIKFKLKLPSKIQ